VFEEERSNMQLIANADAIHRRACRSQRDLFSLIVEIDRREVWQEDGARDMAHWLWMRYGVSDWKARRWIASAHALESLPRIAEAFASGELGVDKVVELTRFATPETEAGLVGWAQAVSSGRIRNRGDLEARRSLRDVQDVERDRRLEWWYFDEGQRFGLEAELPAAEGAVVAKALERAARTLPVLPDEEEPQYASARRADALVALASARISSDPDPDRATVVVHASMEGLGAEDGSCEVEGGGVIHAETARRLFCHARVQTVMEDESGDALRLGRMSREPSAGMLRQLRHRDRECRFPACGSRQFTQAHHVVWWERGGRTDVDNLILICTFHHRLVHEHGWSITRRANGEVEWLRPDGARYRAGPGPPAAQADRNPELLAASF
jgi:hypothetical protein